MSAPPLQIITRIPRAHNRPGRRALLIAAAEAAVRATRPEILASAQPWGASVVLADDVLLHELNLAYRGFDKPTDVLSFENHSVSDRYLGDVIVSMDRVRAQAAKSGHGDDDELALLVVHGLLHLCGHDHETKPDKAVMWARQNQALDALRDAGRVAAKMRRPR